MAKLHLLSRIRDSFLCRLHFSIVILEMLVSGVEGTLCLGQVSAGA